MPQPTPLKPGPTGCLIRDASPKDMAATAAIYDHFVQTSAATFEETSPTSNDMTDRYMELLGKGLPFLIAGQGDQIVGYAYAGPYRSRSGYRYTVEDSVYVDQAHLGKGIGRLLLNELINRCTALGYRQMIAVIGDSANTASIALHSQMGFKVIGALPATGRKFERWVDTVLMQCALGDGATTPPNSAS